MMIEKELTEADLSQLGLYLPKSKMEYILKKMVFPMPQKGLQLEVQDNDKSYQVRLKKVKNKYYFGAGWSNIKHARDLKTGQIIRLYWNDGKFHFYME